MFLCHAPASAATLVSHWSFDDSTANDAVSAQNGTFQNGATTSVSQTAGLLGGRSLDVHDTGATTNQRVTVANSSTINFSNNLSISFWMKANSDGVEASFGQPTAYTRPIAMNQGATTDPGWEFQRNNDLGTLGFRVDTDTSGNQTRTPAYLPFDGGWHHVTVTLASGAMSYYQDGGMPTNYSYVTGTTGFGDALAALTFGASSGGGNQFDGWLDDISLWGTTVLTQGEAKALYALGTILGYDASDANALFTLHNAGAGTTVVNDTLWEYKSGLSGTAGTIQTVGSQQVLFLTGTTGVGLVPEPGRATFFFFFGSLLMWRRTRAGKGV